MQLFHSLMILIFLTGNLYAQDIVKVGDISPNINITDYILNAPNDKNLENKFIILEFWATWCAPCLGAVPHLNELQEKFKERKDLIFLSLTYEKPEKTKRTLEKINFKTVVVADQTKKTETKFNVEGIPHTVLIDNRGVIKWIGTPDGLNSSLIENFISGKNIAAQGLVTDESKPETKGDKKNAESIYDMALKILKDANIQYIFNLMNSTEPVNKMAIEFLVNGKYIDLNNNLKSILAKLIKKPESQINIPDTLMENTYSLIYKNANKMDISAHIDILKTGVLNSFNLQETIETKKVEVYNLKVKNPNKLVFSLNQQEENHSGNNDTHFIFSNAKMEALVKELGDYHKIIIFDETALTKNLDLIIRRGDMNVLMNDLDEYGLVLEKVTKEIEFSTYN